MDANSVLIAALTTYSMDLGDYKVNITATNNAISKCKDYLSHNPVTTDWMKRNWVLCLMLLVITANFWLVKSMMPETPKIMKFLQNYKLNMTFSSLYRLI